MFKSSKTANRPLLPSNSEISLLEDAHDEIIGSNKKYLKDDSDNEKEGENVAVDKMLPNSIEQEILPQTECGYKAAVQLSKFTQSREA